MNPMVAFQIAKGVAAFGQAQADFRRTEADYFRNRQAAAQARDINIQGLNRRAIQEAEAAGQQKVDLAIRALEVQGAKAAAQAETGLSGKTFQRSRALTEAKKLRGETALNTQLEYTLNQIDLEKAGINTQALNRINSLPRGQKPNFALHALQTASSVYAADKEFGDGVFSDKVDSLFNLERFGLTSNYNSVIPDYDAFDFYEGK